MYHTRVFIFDFQDDKLPQFKTREDYEKFEAMIGRMVMYGCYDQQPCDTIQYANGFIAPAGDEMIVSYRKLEAQPETWDDGSRKYMNSPLAAVETFKGAMQREGASYITIGAVLHDDKKWGFHS